MEHGQYPREPMTRNVVAAVKVSTPPELRTIAEEPPKKRVPMVRDGEVIGIVRERGASVGAIESRGEIAA